jgi:hypothetical protein
MPKFAINDFLCCNLSVTPRTRITIYIYIYMKTHGNNPTNYIKAEYVIPKWSNYSPILYLAETWF